MRLRGRVSGEFAAALGPVAVRYEPPVSALAGALDQRQLHALLQRLLTDAPQCVLDVREVGAPAPAPVVSSTPRSIAAPYVLEFAGAVAAEALVDHFGVTVTHRAEDTLVSGQLDAGALAGLLAGAHGLGFELLALRRSTATPAAVRVMIVDDHDGMRAALRELVAAAPGFELVGEAASGEQALAVARQARPMLVVMDVRMPGLGGIEAARRLTREAPGTVVVLVSADPDPEIDPRAWGAVTLLSKRELRSGSLAALWRAHAPRDAYEA